jgi:hypothetical protein
VIQRCRSDGRCVACSLSRRPTFCLYVAQWGLACGATKRTNQPLGELPLSIEETARRARTRSASTKSQRPTLYVRDRQTQRAVLIVSDRSVGRYRAFLLAVTWSPRLTGLIHPLNNVQQCGCEVFMQLFGYVGSLKRILKPTHTHRNPFYASWTLLGKRRSPARAAVPRSVGEDPRRAQTGCGAAWTGRVLI